jgi:hypothetical protein
MLLAMVLTISTFETTIFVNGEGQGVAAVLTETEESTSTASEEEATSSTSTAASTTDAADTKEEAAAAATTTTPADEEQPIQSGPLVDLLGPKLYSLQMVDEQQVQINEQYTTDALRNKDVIGLYFSADWWYVNLSLTH